MKADKHRYEVESSSTQERERRFSRRTIDKNSRSRSNNSDTSSISKFFIKNIEQPYKNNNYNELLRKSIGGGLKWSPPKRDATPHKTMREKQINLSKEELLKQQERDICNFQTQLGKYKCYAKKQAADIILLTTENSDLKDKIQVLESELETQRRSNHNFRLRLEELGHKCVHKEKMLNYYQKEQTSLKKIKNSIYQARLEEFQKQRQELNMKIQQLQQTVEGLKAKNGTVSPINYSFSDLLEHHFVPHFYQDEYTRALELQLFQSKQEIKKLNIHINCQQRKFFKEMTAFKNNKEKDYNELKEKFADFLKKYKELMKKFTSSQVKTLVENRKAQTHREKSSESLLLSSDEESASTAVIQ